MTDTNWNPWRMTTISLLLVGSTAMVTTIVLEYRSEENNSNQIRTATFSSSSVWKVSTPSRKNVDACKSYAVQQSSSKSREFGKDSNYQAAYRSCMREMGY